MHRNNSLCAIVLQIVYYLLLRLFMSFDRCRSHSNFASGKTRFFLIFVCTMHNTQGSRYADLSMPHSENK